ncbi:DUF3043 domain-containing protein [uncultured Tessaracoccus sp.]|uniref:DUF3043 domain-containing protein n=1 Tax=uncultured Tessaracoccus sp. TaxID=905023 RepID=UPI00262B606D|nr:DUF3043 domain-containing protein [uncultured Tessaracoccus sp.]
MGLFRPYERSDKSTRARTSTVPEKVKKAPDTNAATSTDAQEPTSAPAGKKVVRRGAKTGPTPTRKEAEAARMERLHPNLSKKERKKAEREARYKAQTEAWERVEKGPERTLLRDFVDTRWTLAEFMMPFMLIILAAMFVFMANVEITTIIAFLLWGFFFATLINIWIMWRSFKKLLAERVPNAHTKGLLMYMMNRAIMIRRFRRPLPRIKRGDPI